MPSQRLHLSKWLIRVLTWDSVMPVVLIAVPHAVHWLFPQAVKAIELLGVFLPITAFFVRLVVGWRHINANYCSPWARGLQQGVLFVGIFSLVLVDAALILQINIPQANEKFEILMVFLAVSVFIYLPSMVIAMYPGREPVASTAIGNWDVEA
jgi:hypothetical protein